MNSRIYELIGKAEALRQKSQYREALSVFKKAAAHARKIQDAGGLLDSSMAAGDVCRIIGDFDHAVEYYTEALEICEGFCDDLTAADALVGLGLSYRAVGMWQKAMRLIARARKIYVAAGDKKGMAFALWAEAGSLRIAGKIPAAIETYFRARRIFAASGFDSGLGYTLAGLGGAHRIAGKPADSLKYYLEANEIFRSLRDAFGTAYTHCGIGNAWRMKGDYVRATGEFKKAAALYGRIGDIVSYSYTIWSLATLCKMRGNLAEALKYTAEARRNFRKTKDPRGIIYCDLAQGEVAWMMGKEKRAQALIRGALASAVAHKFRLEECHARLLLLNAGKAYRKGAAAKTPSCYKKIGVGLRFDTMPFNLP
jgi:tetratricopeptide (TPR) repeat protein